MDVGHETASFSPVKSVNPWDSELTLIPRSTPVTGHHAAQHLSSLHHSPLHRSSLHHSLVDRDYRSSMYSSALVDRDYRSSMYSSALADRDYYSYTTRRALDDEVLSRPYASWHRYHDRPYSAYLRDSKYDPEHYRYHSDYYRYHRDYYNRLPANHMAALSLEYPAARGVAVAQDWEWVLDETYQGGRRLLVDPNDGQMFEESRKGEALVAVGRVELGRFEEVDVFLQWSFLTTLATRLHRQHSQVQEFFTAWGSSNGGGQLVLHPQSLRRLLRWLMPDITLAETAALQVNAP
jgi:hypothetical protein